MAVRLDADPGTWVMGFEYTLINALEGNLRCSAELGHNAALYVEGSASPVALPTLLDAWSEPAMPTADPLVTYAHHFALPYEVQPGETLFLAVQFRGDVDPGQDGCAEGGPVVCVMSCPTEGAETGSHWSFANQPPFSWQELGSLGLFATPFISVWSFEP